MTLSQRPLPDVIRQAPARRMQALAALLLITLAGCATAPPSGGGTYPAPGAPGAAGAAGFAGVASSPECLARKLKEGDPFPASAIPPAAMAQRQSGRVAVRYDLVDGVPRNLQVVASDPPGLYDAAAQAHAARYRDPARNTVAGCVLTVDVKF